MIPPRQEKRNCEKHKDNENAYLCYVDRKLECHSCQIAIIENKIIDLAEKRMDAVVEELKKCRMEYPEQIKGWHGKALQIRIDNLLSQIQGKDLEPCEEMREDFGQNEGGG